MLQRSISTFFLQRSMPLTNFAQPLKFQAKTL
jgi:hypothetical protein